MMRSAGRTLRETRLDHAGNENSTRNDIRQVKRFRKHSSVEKSGKRRVGFASPLAGNLIAGYCRHAQGDRSRRTLNFN